MANKDKKFILRKDMGHGVVYVYERLTPTIRNQRTTKRRIDCSAKRWTVSDRKPEGEEPERKYWRRKGFQVFPLKGKEPGQRRFLIISQRNPALTMQCTPHSETRSMTRKSASPWPDIWYAAAEIHSPESKYGWWHMRCRIPKAYLPKTPVRRWWIKSGCTTILLRSTSKSGSSGANALW